MSELNKSSRAVLVTGAARRIGKSIATALAADGWNVAIHHHRSGEEALRLADELQALGVRAAAVKCDLADAAAVSGLIGECARRVGPLSCLVNNASLFEFDDPRAFDPTTWQQHAAINLCAPLQLVRDFAAQVPPDTVGCVVNMLDQKVFNLNPDFFSYTLTKVAMEGATRMLAMALAPKVRVCGIAPGITLVSGEQTKKGFERAHAQAPLGHSSDLDDIVGAVRYLIAAKSVTGHTVLVDGGQHLWPLKRDVQFEVS
ncbi:MAG: short-chain dehydrogenase [Betaproteobacteria bacterium SG8_40]|nr:MAG: short-chain dehydrogenase [Betaproteobacteria bacterium SG8_40]